LDTTKRWENPRLDKQESYFDRIEEDRKKPIIDFVIQVNVDPCASRAYGWYTSGTEEIVRYVGMNNGFPPSIVF
jgi:hypothetical protein